jgi:hypothetical protein
MLPFWDREHGMVQGRNNRAVDESRDRSAPANPQALATPKLRNVRALASAVVECTKNFVGGVRVEQIDDELTGEFAIGKQGAGT